MANNLKGIYLTTSDKIDRVVLQDNSLTILTDTGEVYFGSLKLQGTKSYVINGSVAGDGTITFSGLVIADLISAVTANTIIIFKPTATYKPILLAGTINGSTYTLNGSLTTNDVSNITNYECIISVVSGVATGTYTAKQAGAQHYKVQFFDTDGTTLIAECYRGKNEYIKRDDLNLASGFFNIDYPYAVLADTNFISTGVNDIDNLSWDDIITIANEGRFTSDVLGQTKTLTINGAPYTVQIIGVNHDDLTDGTGKANLTFQLKYLLSTTYKMNDSGTNEGGWEASDMRTSTMATLLSQLPTNLQNAIKSVQKANCKVYNSATITYTSDKLFLLSEAELSGDNSNTAALEGTQYEYWANNNTASARIKYTGEGGTSANSWWLRSPSSSSSNVFCYVRTSGWVANLSASISLGVSFAFDL